MRFLHISDCHFGFEKSIDAQAHRDNYMEKLLEQVKEIISDAPVDYLFITGDIGWKAQKSDYKIALKYIRKLIEACQLDTQHVFICPGNHDVDRNAIADKAFPKEQCEANTWLNVARLNQYLAPGFSNYIEFCTELELPQYIIGEYGNYLVGVAETNDLRVISLNSSWYALSDEVKDKMWIGANFLQVIQQDIRRTQQAKENESGKQQVPTKLTVALIHHPSAKWHEEETTNLAGKTNVLRELCNMSDIILTGHTHEISCELWYHEGTIVTGTGAVYNDHTYNNSFYVYDLTPSCPERTHFYQYANKWACGKAEMLRGYRLDSKLKVNIQSQTDDSVVFSQQQFDKAMSAISFYSVDECVKKWFLQDSSQGYPIYRNIQSNERVLRFLKQFVFFENKEALIDDLFEKCIDQIRNNEVVVLRGAQGTGKSTALSLLYIAALNSYRNGELDAYPLYVDIHKYMIADKLGNMGDFCDDINKLTAWLDKNENCQKYVVFIDGIDEYVSGSEEYETEIYNKIVRNHQDKIVLCIGTIEDVDQSRLAVSQFQNFIDQDSIIIETRAAQVQTEKIDELVARVAGAFDQKLGKRQEKFLKKWILQYSNGTIDYRTILMLYRIVNNDETSVTRSLAANLKIYLINKLSVDSKEFSKLAINAVNYMLGTQLKLNTKVNISQGMILHRDKLIRDYLLSYYFVDHAVYCESSRQQQKQRAMCQWNVVFPRTVCRFIRDLMEDRSENYLATLANMYDDSSEEMKCNICFLLGRLHENANKQKAMLKRYLQKVDYKTSFALYKTIMISLICLREVDAEKEYVSLLINNSDYAKEHLRLHCKYYYDNCEYVNSRGRYGYAPLEVLRLVINNTKNSILNGIRKGWEDPILRQRHFNSLYTDIVTFYTALLSLGKDNMKRDYLEEAKTVCMAIQNSDLISIELKSYAQITTFAYELQQKPIQL